jgi:DNA invertase Pin-like site-specific DNA recombinase
MAIISYIRVSTAGQNTARQETMAENVQADKVFIDKCSGKNANRPQLKAMLDYVREGDTVVVESFSRLARSTRDLLDIVGQLTEKGVQFKSLHENIDTTTPQGRFMLTVFGALAELEREQTLQRQREGIYEAQKAGKYKGRAPIEIDEKKFASICKQWRAGEITAVQAQKRLGLKANTFYRRVKQMGL